MLSRLCVYENVLQATVTGVARGAAADQLRRSRFSSIGGSDTDLAAFLGRTRPVFGVVHGDILMTAAGGGTAAGGPDIYEIETRFAVPRPAGHRGLQLAVGWPGAGLNTVEIILNPDGRDRCDDDPAHDRHGPIADGPPGALRRPANGRR